MSEWRQWHEQLKDVSHLPTSELLDLIEQGMSSSYHVEVCRPNNSDKGGCEHDLALAELRRRLMSSEA